MAKFGVVHYNFKGNFQEFMKFAAETGFEYMEIMAQDLWPKDMGFDEAKQHSHGIKVDMDKLGLKVSALAAQNDFLVADSKEMALQVERLQQVGELAKIVDTNILRVDGGWPKEGVAQEQWMDLMVEGFKRCRDFIEKEGFLLALDNHGIVTNDAAVQIALFEAVESENMGANLDTMNYRWAGHSLETVNGFYAEIAPYVLHVHMKDGRNSFRDYEGTVLGEGEIDLKWAVECLQKVNYQGVWCVEYEGKTTSGEGFRKGLRWLREHLS
mgnify:FL=1